MNDSKRNSWCLLGLPFDAIDFEKTIEKIHVAALEKKQLFISTPNVNFLVASMKNAQFRESVINSDLSLVDGKILFWIAKFIGIPLPGKISGSDLIEELIENKHKYTPLKIFFFGGDEGIAEQACKKLNNTNKGLHCVGFCNPGFGSIKEMSAPVIFERINQCDADLLIVSLGAAKGQAWIEHNKNEINTPVISHLGAVVNFVAGNVNRAPKLVQNIGLEWLWRIKEEPSLWRRYFFDAMILLVLMFRKVIPGYLYLLVNKRKFKKNAAIKLTKYSNADKVEVDISGNIFSGNINELNIHFQDVHIWPDSITINIDGVAYFDYAFMGYLLYLRKICNEYNKKLLVKTSSSYIRKIFTLNCCDYIIG